MAAETLSLDERRRQAMDLAVSCTLGDIPLTARQTALLHTARDALLERPRAVVKLEAERTDAPAIMVAAAVAAAMHVLASQRPVLCVSLEHTPSATRFVVHVHNFLASFTPGRPIAHEDMTRLVYGEDKDGSGQSLLVIGRGEGSRVLITDTRELPAEEPDTTILWITRAAN